MQIPCFNEEHTLAEVVNAIPKNIDGIEVIEMLVIDDGSTDRTVAKAQSLGVNHILQLEGNRGLAKAFQAGIERCVELGADIIVNTDGDHQYSSLDIPKLIEPILDKRADIVVGCRGGMENPHFSWFKRLLQVVGSYFIRSVTRLDISDAVSGFRAFNRQSAQRLNIVSDFSYTIEMLVQAGAKRMRVCSVPVSTNPKSRESRLFKSIPQFLLLSVTTLLRVYVMYRPLMVFQTVGFVALIVGAAPIGRFIYYFFNGGGEGHIQSLVIGGILMSIGGFTILIGLVADLINFNRRLIEQLLLNQKKLEEAMRSLADGNKKSG